MLFHTGDLFRRFRILGKAGQGGMGIVYRAHDVKLAPSHGHYFPTDREVVTKVVDAISRFIDTPQQ